MEFAKIKKTNSDIILINDDCFNTIKKMKKSAKMVDIILTSPPYNTSRPGRSDEYNGRYDEFSDKMSKNDYSKWTIDLFQHYDEILSKNGVVLYNLSYSSENTDGIWLTISDVIRNTEFTIADTIIWKKSNAIPNNRSKNKLTRITEYIFVFVRKTEIKTFNSNKKVVSTIEKTGQNNYENIFNLIEAKNNDGSCKLNKATFSSDLVVSLLNIYANKNSVVYDSFMGTGTTAIGCIRFGCSFVGTELSYEQFKYSAKRVNEFEDGGD